MSRRIRPYAALALGAFLAIPTTVGVRLVLAFSERATLQLLFDELRPVPIKGCEMERFGAEHDGGYLMCANLLEDVGVAYSYGIGGRDSWGCAISRRYDVTVHQYDCFDTAQPSCPGGSFSFHPECIDETRGTIDGRDFDSLSSQFATNGDSGMNLVVKMDVEGAEWDALLSTPDPVLGNIDQPPLIADGKVVLGFAGGDRLTRGLVVAHDAETGERIWTTCTVPREGEPGWESWTEREIPPMGGGTWGTISYDPELGLIYLGTGQPTPWASTLRGPGDALYTNSILALDIDTGELEWYFQVVPADNWDLDATHESMLVDLDIGGRGHKALIETSKIGWGLVLDRETGRFLHAFRTGYDNLITGWTDSGSPIYNPALIPTMDDVDSDKVFEVCPHYHGTRNLNAPSYSPQTGLYYVGINNSCMDVTFISEEAQPGRVYRGVGTRPKPVPGYDYVGEFVAFNPVTGQRAWEYRHPDGAAMTASALALDAETGDHLWETRLNGDISGAPVTFEVDGRQYLAVGAGGRIAMTTSYALFTETRIPQGSGVMWVFALPE